MDAKHTLGHWLPSRVILTAALLAERYQNADVVAYRRATSGERRCGNRYIVAPSTPRREQFWFSVGRALGAAYERRGCPTNYERAVRIDIDKARAAIAKATGA